MRLTKFGHACIRINHQGHDLVIDPGVFTDPEAVDGVTAVLVTHEHLDHYQPDRLRRAEAPIFTTAAVAAKITDEAPDLAERVTVVAPGERFEAGFEVQAVGELHEVIHPEIPRVHNCGYLIWAGDTSVFHPGDALTAPDQPVDLLCGVVCAPWMRTRDGIDFARQVGAPRTLAIHDRVYSEAGLGIADAQFSSLLAATGQEYLRIPDGADLP